MLQFIKKWHQAFKEDKELRVAKEYQNTINPTVQADSYDFWGKWSDGANDYYEEQKRKGEYY
ncbi:hypothetical protein RJD38_21505 (plasmid) [Vibrio scophthalmi]|uniref:Uncharacterized protein n=1 Tax=Vibrio ichthyoenteri ATCC 700023 TaxID=870968 RepID=F9S232_9VIBR|nr:MULTISPECIES: hypothetical protein [Vibrio]ANS88147.1 hypothetical protein VSVS12_04448 [Vibrio scophthalmi]EGU40191.1 hypothetical protein VII00023_15471 [Vibrio ichthyoenteri ATCC 700023]